MSCQTSTWFGLWTTLETTLWTEWVSDNARQYNDQTWVRYLEQVNLKHQLRIKRSRWKRLRACALKRKQEMKQNPSSSLFLSHPGWAEQWIEPHHKHHHQNIQNFGCILDKKGGGYWERNEPWDLWLPLTSISSNHIFHISPDLNGLRNWNRYLICSSAFPFHKLAHWYNNENICLNELA